ncbi:MAG: glycosyltransferase family 4 protein [Firmicutes bacterium]|nr:glycosyltransferase [Alicyclobacillaceae bacterium]MCL6497095.1 glycosyltransferase family 4 protein [Bacillota bacterium]
MRVAVVAGRGPWPIRGGEAVRLDAWLRVLSRRHEVTLAVPGGTACPLPALSVVALPPLSRRLWAILRHPFLPTTVALAWDRDVAAAVQRVVAAHDRTLFYQLRTTAWLPSPRAGVAVDLTDALSLYYRRRARREPWWAFEAWRTARWEQGVVARWPAFVVSDHDRKALAGSTAPKLVVARNGVFGPPPGYRREPKRRRWVTVGNWTYWPNRSGLRRFLAQVWPEVLRVHRDAELWVAGSGAIPAALPAGVRWLGPMEDLAPLYAGAWAAVAPVEFGAGTKTKVLEALAYGVGVVTTPVGAEGLPVEAGILVVRERSEWIRALAEEWAAESARCQSVLASWHWEKTLAPAVEVIEG